MSRPLDMTTRSLSPLTHGDKPLGAMSNGRDMPSDDRSEEQMLPAERLLALKSLVLVRERPQGSGCHATSCAEKTSNGAGLGTHMACGVHCCATAKTLLH